MSGHGEKQSRRAEAAIGALLTCSTLEAAAEQAGIVPSTLRRWLVEPAFQQRFREARRQAVEQAVAALQRAASESVETLQRNLTCGVPTAEIAAAKAILDQAFRGLEVIDLVERIEQLEHAQRAPNGTALLPLPAVPTMPTNAPLRGTSARDGATE